MNKKKLGCTKSLDSKVTRVDNKQRFLCMHPFIHPDTGPFLRKVAAFQVDVDVMRYTLNNKKKLTRKKRCIMVLFQV